MDKVFVKVCGTTNTGKTTVALIIEKALKEAGFNVIPFDNQEDSDIKRKRLESGILMTDSIASRVEVEIDEIQLTKGFYKPLCIHNRETKRCMNEATQASKYCVTHEPPPAPMPPPPRVVKEGGPTFIDSIKQFWSRFK